MYCLQFLASEGIDMRKKREIFSVKEILLAKSREAALSAIQIYNNPLIKFKTETFIVLMIIAWTYLLHAFYKSKKIDYRYVDKGKSTERRKVYLKVEGRYKLWELATCLEQRESPVSLACKQNLQFLIGLRNRIEHQMVPIIEDIISARLHACGLNYNKYIVSLFNPRYAIDKDLMFSLQFHKISENQQKLTDKYTLPTVIKQYIQDFDNSLSQDEYESEEFAVRYFFVRKTNNHKGTADQVVEFIPADSELSKGINKQYVVIKETEKKKFLPGQIVQMMQDKGFKKFKMHHFIDFWHMRDAKNSKYHYGEKIAKTTWYWYENWVKEVEDYCLKHATDFK